MELFLVDAPLKRIDPEKHAYEHASKRSRIEFTSHSDGGDITDTSESKKDEKGYGNRIQVRVVDSTKTDDATDPKIAKEDRKCTTYYPAKDTINTSIYQQLDFGIKPRAYGIRQGGDTFSNVSLIIVYYSNDNSIKEFRLKFYDIDEYGNGKWVYYSNQLPKHTDQFESEIIDLTEYINTPKDLESFKVRIEASTESSESAGKAIFIDYMALWLEKENNLAHPESVE